MQWKVIGNSKGEGVCGAKHFKGMYEAKLEIFPEEMKGGGGEGVETPQKNCEGSINIFWKNTLIFTNY